MPSIDYNSAADVTKRLEERLVESLTGETSVSRRTVLGSLGVAGSAAVGLGSSRAAASSEHDDEDGHGNFGAVGEYQDLD
ncbi:copper oxidase, partial [Halorubrum sp. SD626R]